MKSRRVCALTIAGSDSGGGAGIQADLKTFAAHGVHGLCAITALTAQHTRAVTTVHIVPADFLRAQIDACYDDFEIGAIKLGMLADAQIIEAVIESIQKYQPPCVVLDPVMVATSGARLLAHDALDSLQKHLLPLATIVTPNIPEAELLIGERITDAASADAAMHRLRALGASAVLLKGGHLDEGEQVVDRYADATTTFQIIHQRIDGEAHGTGCTLAAAIAAQCCLGLPLAQACRAATDYVARALKNGFRPGLSDVMLLGHGNTQF